MKKSPLYSRSRAPRPGIGAAESATEVLPGAAPQESAPTAAGPAPAAAARRSGLRGVIARQERRLWAVAVLALLTTGVVWNHQQTGSPRALTMKQIDAAMRKSIDEKPLSSPVAAAYDAVLPSVVRVVGLLTDGDDGGDHDDVPAPNGKKGRISVERGIGTGVVIIDNGTILTNLHVVSGAKRIKITFFDGSESDAVVLSTQPENDLAVLRAKSIPDDLEAATMRSTDDLSPGDQVLAVGFPFGIGPSASAGVVSGLKREFRSPEGKQVLTNLIQFDAAANPGNSGGPLVTMDGSVVGIVTAILNPSHQRTFIGIGFAIPIENAAAAAGTAPF